MPPSGSLLCRSTPSAGARTGRPPAANRSQPWWKWKKPAKRGSSQSSWKLAGPPTGKRPKPMRMISSSGTPASNNGFNTASSGEVALAGVRMTLSMIACAPGGTICGPGGSGPSGSTTPGAPPGPAGTVVDVAVVLDVASAVVVDVVVVDEVLVDDGTGSGSTVVDVVDVLSCGVDVVVVDDGGSVVVVLSDGRMSPGAPPTGAANKATTNTMEMATAARRMWPRPDTGRQA